jgi:hypothetical protein
MSLTFRDYLLVPVKKKGIYKILKLVLSLTNKLLLVANRTLFDIIVFLKFSVGANSKYKRGFHNSNVQKLAKADD